MINRKVTITILLVIILMVAIFASNYYETQQVKSYDFKLTLSSKYGEIVQGANIQVPLNVTENRNSNLTVTLSAQSNSSDLQYSIQPNSDISNFTSMLRVSSSNSTPTNYYQVSITATNGKVTHVASYIIGILNAKVLVEAQIDFPHSNSPFETHVAKMTFLDTSTGTYSTIDSSNSYSLTLENQHSYNATVYYYFEESTSGVIGSIGSYDFGTFTIYSPVGNSSKQIHTFTLPWDI